MSHFDEDVERAAQVVQQPVSHGSVGVAELTHGVLRGDFSEYLDGSLESSGHDRVERHVRECQPCSAYLETLRATIDLTHQLPSKAAPGSVKAAILHRAQSEA